MHEEEYKKGCRFIMTLIGEINIEVDIWTKPFKGVNMVWP